MNACNGLCLTAADIGILGYPGQIAYLHPDCEAHSDHANAGPDVVANNRWDLPLRRTEAGYPDCSTCDGGGCPDCTDPA